MDYLEFNEFSFSFRHIYFVLKTLRNVTINVCGKNEILIVDDKWHVAMEKYDGFQTLC